MHRLVSIFDDGSLSIFKTHCVFDCQARDAVLIELHVRKPAKLAQHIKTQELTNKHPLRKWFSMRRQARFHCLKNYQKNELVLRQRAPLRHLSN